VVIFLECRHDGVVLHPGGEWFPAEGLGHTTEHNKLVRTVRALVNGPQGKGASIEVRFLVRPDGQLTMQRANEALLPLGVTRRQQALQREDDVAAVVAGR
jgi:hypothetical protein